MVWAISMLALMGIGVLLLVEVAAHVMDRFRPTS